MEWTFKLVLAVIAGCFAFFVMKKMTKWVFRIIVIGVIIAVVFYSSITLEDVKGVFKKGHVTQPEQIVSESALEESPENITAEEPTSLTEQEQQ